MFTAVSSKRGTVGALYVRGLVQAIWRRGKPEGKKSQVVLLTYKLSERLWKKSPRMCTYRNKVLDPSTTYLYSLIQCTVPAKWNKKNGCLDRHGTLILLTFLKLPLLLHCLLIAFATSYAKKGPELRFFLSNKRFGGKKNLPTKTYNLVTEIFWVSRQLAP